MSQSDLWPQTTQHEARSVASLLSRYPGPVVIKQAAMTLLISAAGSAIVGGVFLWGALDGQLSAAKQAGLWFGAAFCLGVGPLFLIILAIGGESLQLSREGLEIVFPWRSYSIRWRDTSEFAAAVPPGLSAKMIVFNDATRTKPRFLKLPGKLADCNMLLANYGFTPEELAALLNTWRTRALRDDASARRW